MENQKPFLRELTLKLTPLVSFIALILTIIAFVADTTKFGNFFYLMIILLTLTYISFTTYVILRKGKPRKVVILGPVASGKTVYLMVLIYKALLDDLGKSYKVLFSDKESMLWWQEGVWGLMKDKELPAPTPPEVEGESVKFTIKKGGKFVPQQFDLEVVDYSGELSMMIQDDNPYGIKLTDVDGIIFLIDANDLQQDVSRHRQYLKTISTISLFTSGPKQKSPIPIALVISKSDLLKERETPEFLLESTIPELLQLCRGRFSDFKFFFVSSLGDNATQEWQLINEPEPFGVEDPIQWIFQKIS